MYARFCDVYSPNAEKKNKMNENKMKENKISKELNDLCEEYNFDDKFKKYVGAVELFYDIITQEEKRGLKEADKNKDKLLSMTEWIIENTKVDELDNLSNRDKFLYGLGVLTSELSNY